MTRSRLHALCDGRLTATLEGVELTIPTTRCDWWLPAVAGGQQPHHMLADLLDDSGVEALNDLLVSGRVEFDAIVGVALDLLAEASGRDWWVAVKIVDAAEAMWDHVGGQMATSGVTPERVTFCAWLDAVWYLIRKAVAGGKTGEQDLRELVTEVEARPAFDLRREAGDGEEVGMDEDAFMAAAAAMTGPVAG